MSGSAAPLRAGDLVPHFVVVDVAGRRVDYREAAWQRRELVLVTQPSGAGATQDPHTRRFVDGMRRIESQGVVVVVTSDGVPGMPSCGFLVADRWGEIAVVEPVHSPAALPPPEGLLEWVTYVQQQCPECQAEAR